MPPDLSASLGPLDVLYCWQSVLLAVGVSALTHVVKGGIDVGLGGKAERRRAMWANRVVLPLTPIVLGALGAVLVPLLPPVLVQYLTDQRIHGAQYWMSLAAYGGAVGQFSDYVWHRFSGVFDNVKTKNENAAASDAADPRPVVAAVPENSPPVAPVDQTKPPEV